MARAILALLLLCSALPAGAAGVARPSVVLEMICDLNGMEARLHAEIELIRVVDGSWVESMPVDRFRTLDLGEYSSVYGGSVTSPAARYVFTGRDAYADFTELATHERFRVRFVWQRDGLLMVINPFQPPEWRGRHLCRFPG